MLVGAQPLAYVNVTLAVPPVLTFGALTELFVDVPFVHPPPAFTVANHVAYFVLIADCV